MSLSLVLKQGMLNQLFNKGSFTPPTSLKLGVSATTPDSAGGNITEPTGGGYLRKVTAPADWTTASAEDPTKISNIDLIAFSPATDDWLSGLNLTCTVYFDQDDNYVGYGAFVRSKPVLAGDVLQFDPGNLFISLAG